MKLRASLLLAVFTLCLPVAATADKQNNLVIYAAVMACLSQNPSLANTPVGITFRKSPNGRRDLENFQRWTGSCLRRREYVPEALCEKLLNEKDPFEKYRNVLIDDVLANELAGLSELMDCTPQPDTKEKQH